MEKKIWTVKDVLSWTVNYLKKKGFEDPKLDVEYLLAFVLKTTRMNLYLQLDRPMSQKELSVFKQLVKKRLQHVPIQYITRRAYIWKYEFFVDEGVFIPRRETEILIEVAISSLKRAESSFILDVGCGTGCVILSILKDLEHIRGIAVDISKKAMEVFRKNVKALGVGNRVEGVVGDVFEVFSENSKFDAVVSNPPYIKSEEIERLALEIKYHEPKEAIDGGKDGLSFIRKLVKFAYPRIKEGGFLALEVGYNQSKAVKFLMEHTGFKKIRMEKDLSGIERVVQGWKL